MLSPSKLKPCKVFFPEEALSTEIGCSDLGTSKVLQIIPLKMSSTVVIGMDQLVCKHITHVPLRVDIVLTQDNLSMK